MGIPVIMAVALMGLICSTVSVTRGIRGIFVRLRSMSVSIRILVCTVGLVKIGLMDFSVIVRQGPVVRDARIILMIVLG